MIDQRARILSEINLWQACNNEHVKESIDVYIDMKSPHAYLAIRPSLMLAKDFQIRINFLPYTLSYIETGVTTEINDKMERKPLNDAADRKARMFYTTAREYAKLQDLPFRSPYRLLDSELAHKAFLFAKHQDLEIAFMLKVCTLGWGSGWREFELESMDDLHKVLVDCGANLEAFGQYISESGDGIKELENCKLAAEASGIAGVPHYVLTDHDTQKGLSLFGREHLSLIRSKLSERDLKRRESVASEFPHTWSNP